MQFLVQRHNWNIFIENEQRVVVAVNGDHYRAIFNEFLFTKIEEEELATFSFNRTALHARESKLHSTFCALFLEIALSAEELMWLASSEL